MIAKGNRATSFIALTVQALPTSATSYINGKHEKTYFFMIQSSATFLLSRSSINLYLNDMKSTTMGVKSFNAIYNASQKRLMIIICMRLNYIKERKSVEKQTNRDLVAIYIA